MGTKKNTHEEWIVLVQMRCQEKENKWWNARMWYPWVTNANDRYCKTRQEAFNVLDHAYKKWNGSRVYDINGKRHEQMDIGGGFGATLVSDKKMDHDMEIVRHKIRKRIVTDWETVEGI